MDKKTKLEKLKVLVNDSNIEDTTLELYLDIATDKVLKTAYPFDRTIKKVPVEYEMIELNVANYLISKIGAEGQIAHNENGINRTYESADVPSSLLKGIIPKVGHFSK